MDRPVLFGALAAAFLVLFSSCEPKRAPAMACASARHELVKGFGYTTDGVFGYGNVLRETCTAWAAK